jgi:ATP-dependent helicase/nuclease subunit B
MKAKFPISNFQFQHSHVSLPLDSSLIGWLAADILAQYPEERDLSQIAVVFPGRRPALYLRRELGRLIGAPFHPPQIFDIDSFMAYIACKSNDAGVRRDASQVELLHLVYTTAIGMSEDAEYLSLPEKTSSFEGFFFWGLKFLDLFDELGTELVPPERIKQVVPAALANAGITEETRGFWPILPEFYNKWLDSLADHSLWSRGEKYRIASEHIDAMAWPFSQIYLAGFAALNRAEEKVFSALTRIAIARVVIQDGTSQWRTTGAKWEHLERLRSVCHGTWDLEINRSSTIEPDIQTETNQPPDTLNYQKIRFHQGTDLHSQLQMAEDVFAREMEGQGGLAPDQKAIVLPRPEPLIPVLNRLFEDTSVPYNISMGYPLERTALAQLFDSVFEAQEGRVDGKYYAAGYLSVLRHPYIKGLRLYSTLTIDYQNHRFSATDTDRQTKTKRSTNQPINQSTNSSLRSVVHFLEAWLVKEKKSFVGLDELENAIADLDERDCSATRFLSIVHQLCFRGFENLNKVGELAMTLKRLLEWIMEYGTAAGYPLTGEFMSAMVALLEELESRPVAEETASVSGLHSLLGHLVRQTRIPFQGIPLEGFQILGFLETRCLKFQHVMIFDVNEGVLPPKIRPDPILPPDLRSHLGLPDKKQAVEISRYHLQRLLAGAEKIHLFFSEDRGRMRSRFIEEFIWEAEKQAGRRNVIPVHRTINIPKPRTYYASPVKKTQKIIDFLSLFTFSATALDTYLYCPFRFYAKYILKLDIPDTIDMDEIDPLLVGNLVHKILKEFYSPWLDREINFDADYNNDIVTKSDIELKEIFGPKSEWSGGVRLFREVLIYRLKNFLRIEKEHSHGHSLMGLEVPCKMDFHLEKGRKVGMKGVLDRVERDREGIIWVIDYKTGSKVQMPRATIASNISDRKSIRQELVSFQLPIYLLLCDRHYALESLWSKINAALYSLRGLEESSSLNALRTILFKHGDGRDRIVKGIYVPALKTIIREILNPEIPFTHDPSDFANCRTCPYIRRLCKVG